MQVNRARRPIQPCRTVTHRAATIPAARVWDSKLGKLSNELNVRDVEVPVGNRLRLPPGILIRSSGGNLTRLDLRPSQNLDILQSQGGDFEYVHFPTRDGSARDLAEGLANEHPFLYFVRDVKVVKAGEKKRTVSIGACHRVNLDPRTEDGMMNILSKIHEDRYWRSLCSRVDLMGNASLEDREVRYAWNIFFPELYEREPKVCREVIQAIEGVYHRRLEQVVDRHWVNDSGAIDDAFARLQHLSELKHRLGISTKAQGPTIPTAANGENVILPG